MSKKKVISLERTESSNILLWEKEAHKGYLYYFEVRFSENPQINKVFLIDHILPRYYSGEIIYADSTKNHLLVSYFNGSPFVSALERDERYPALYRAIKFKYCDELMEFYKCKNKNQVAFTSIIWENKSHSEEEFCVVWRKERSEEYQCFGLHRERLYTKADKLSFYD